MKYKILGIIVQKKSFISQETAYIQPIFVGGTKNDFTFDLKNENWLGHLLLNINTQLYH